MLEQFKLMEPVVEALRQHRDQQDLQRDKKGAKWQDLDLVFTTRDGGPLRQSNIRRSFKKILSDLEIAGVRLYDLRHSAATLALSAGVKPKVISEQLGHASVSLTMDVYSHVLPHMQEEAAAQVQAHLWGDEVHESGLAHIWHTNAENGHPQQGTPFSVSGS